MTRPMQRRVPLPFTDQQPSRSTIERIQLDKLNALLARLSDASPFYRDRLPMRQLDSLEQLTRFPFTTADDIRAGGLLAIPAPDVARMVGIPTSGSQGAPKRIAFSESDLEDTRTFFAEGIRCIARAGEATAVLFPFETPLSLGALIGDALERIGATPLLLGLPVDGDAALDSLAASGATSAVGSARSLLDLARLEASRPEHPPLERILLSSDNAEPDVKELIAGTWDCEVFEHYGMAETGYGIAVDCPAHAGMHIREMDMIVEIVDPQSGAPLPEGTEGEVVITTLNREAMPLIRYRTGDLSRIVPGACPCAGTLRRLGRVRGHAIAGTAPAAPSWKF